MFSTKSLNFQLYHGKNKLHFDKMTMSNTLIWILQHWIIFFWWKWYSCLIIFFYYLYFQQEDLVFLGKVVLALACNSIMAIQRDSFTNSMELVARNYSADLKNFFVSVLVPIYLKSFSVHKITILDLLWRKNSSNEGSNIIMYLIKQYLPRKLKDVNTELFCIYV